MSTNSHRTLTDDALVTIWSTLEAKGKPALLTKADLTGLSDELLTELNQREFLQIQQSSVTLTDKGQMKAEQLARSRRLAERMVTDLLGNPLGESTLACSEGQAVLPESVDLLCSLLGHPRFCPHHRPIPAGECCHQRSNEGTAILLTIDRLPIGATGRIAYIGTPNLERAQKLSALGVTRGVVLKLRQKTPSFVIQCDETEIALESDIARGIFVYRLSA